MVSMSLPHFSEEAVDPPHFLRKHHHERDKDGWLSISRHLRVLFAFSLTQQLIVLLSEVGGAEY
jgi:hypothetical protein